jgi:copper homeostasis protein (lipoprotein)
MTSLKCIALVALAFLIHQGCVSGCCNRPVVASDPGYDLTRHVTLSLPATYTGVLPCADCDGLRYTLNLWSDQVVFRRMTHLGQGADDVASDDDVGRWSFSADGSMLSISTKDATPDVFAIEGRELLRKLDSEGNPVASDSAYTLARQERVIWFEPHVRMHGMYSSSDGHGTFTECLSRLGLTVAREGDYAGLEQSYSFARNETGEAILVSLDGRITSRARPDGQGKEQVLVVDKFLSLWAGETCWPEVKVAARSCGK